MALVGDRPSDAVTLRRRLGLQILDDSTASSGVQQPVGHPVAHRPAPVLPAAGFVAVAARDIPALRNIKTLFSASTEQAEAKKALAAIRETLPKDGNNPKLTLEYSLDTSGYKDFRIKFTDLSGKETIIGTKRTDPTVTTFIEESEMLALLKSISDPRTVHADITGKGDWIGNTAGQNLADLENNLNQFVHYPDNVIDRTLWEGACYYASYVPASLKGIKWAVWDKACGVPAAYQAIKDSKRARDIGLITLGVAGTLATQYAWSLIGG